MSRYDAFPDHPLCGVPDEILTAARAVMEGAVIWKDVAPDTAEPLADAVVMGLLPWLRTDDGWAAMNERWAEFLREPGDEPNTYPSTHP